MNITPYILAGSLSLGDYFSTKYVRNKYSHVTDSSIINNDEVRAVVLPALIVAGDRLVSKVSNKNKSSKNSKKIVWIYRGMVTVIVGSTIVNNLKK